MWRDVLTAIAGCLVMATAVAASASDPIAGEWDLDAAKSTVNGQPAFKSGHVSAVVTKDGRKASVDIVPSSGAAVHYEFAGKYDGETFPVTGNASFDSASMVKPDRNTTIRTERRAGKVVSITTIEVAKDGKTFTSTSKGTSPDGHSFTRTLTWTRAKAKKK
jgi:hypothetical protein